MVRKLTFWPRRLYFKKLLFFQFFAVFHQKMSKNADFWKLKNLFQSKISSWLIIVMYRMTRHFKAEKLHFKAEKLRFLYVLLYPLSQKVAKIWLKNKDWTWAKLKNAKMLVDAREVLVSDRNLQKWKVQIIVFQTHYLRSVLDNNSLRKKHLILFR